MVDRRNGYIQVEKNRSGYHAYRALFLKNLTYQKRQTALNVCQIVFVSVVMLVMFSVFAWMHSITGTGSNDNNMSYIVNYTNTGQTVVPKNSDQSVVEYWRFLTLTQDPGTDDIGELGNRTWSPSSGLLGSIPQQKQYRGSWQFDIINISSPSFLKFPSQAEADQYAVDRFNYWNTLNVSTTIAAMQIPVASVNVHKWNQAQKKLDITLQTFSDDSYAWWIYNLEYGSGSSFYRVGFVPTFTNYFSNGLIRTLLGNDNFIMQAISTSLPYWSNSYFSIAILEGMMAIWFIPSALGFIFPIFVTGLVFEKNEKLVEMMKMMGMKMSQYWVINFLFSLTLYLILAAIVFIVSVASQAQFASSANAGYLFLLLLLFGPSLVAFSFFYSTFFSNVSTATKIGFFLSLVLAGAGPAIMLFAFGANPISSLWLFIPQLALQRGFFIIIYHFGGYAPPGFVSFTGGPLAQVYLMQIVSTIVYLVLAKYLDDVLPREHGIRYSPFYPITSTYKFIKSKTSKGAVYEQVPLLNREGATDDLESTIQEDPDVRAERARIERNTDLLVKIVNLNKTYPPRGGQPAKLALESFTLGMNEGEALGLLGPNGAGKTTLISMLCGMIPPTSGTAFVNNFDIRTNMNDVHSVLGYCPQHDILWPTLTVEEHLLFYTRLKGYPTHLENQHVAEVALRVGLSGDSITKKVSELSGGMKRRLSVAIATVGDTRLVLLDEPTTGLDPESRRSIWDIIAANREGRSYIITTHNMEEADVLCTKIAIVSQGRMQCLGAPQYLKTKFGGGYVLNVSIVPNADPDAIISHVRSMCPNSVLSSPNIAGGSSLEFTIPHTDVIMSQVFAHMEKSKEELGVSEWAINQTSLEHVFMKIASNVES